jgi:hypothetical protein
LNKENSENIIKNKNDIIASLNNNIKELVSLFNYI